MSASDDRGVDGISWWVQDPRYKGLLEWIYLAQCVGLSFRESMEITMSGNDDAHPNLDEHCRTECVGWIATSVEYRQMILVID